MQSKVIIFTGFLATLKTTISKKVSKDLNIISINKDDIKELLVDTIGFQTREDNKKLSQASFELIKFQLIQHVEHQQDIIIESNFKNHELNEILELLSNHNVKVLIVFCYGDLEIIYERYVLRQKNRHIAHLSTGTISKDIFKSSYETYHIPNTEHKTIMLDTSIFLEQDYNKLLKEFKLFLNV